MRDFSIIVSLACLFSSSLIMGRTYSDASRFGNKTTNLAQIDDYMEQIRQSGIQVAVPSFFGIASDEILTFLEKNGQRSSIEEYWRNFIQAQQNVDDLTDDGRNALLGIQESLSKSFTNQEFHLTEESADKELELFLLQFGDEDRLMVRSTGKEDTKEIANAGGNKSIANVKANRLLLSAALLEVLQSYFSEKSYKQRIAGGESKESLLGQIFMPVLLQLMIGEKKGIIPVAGVVFSREPLANTANVVAINSTFGHGETVVNGLYPVDSYFLMGSTVYPVIRNKHTRLSPDEAKQGLEPKINSAKMSKKSSLTREQVLALGNIAINLERLRGEPVDIEFTLLGDVIHLVQVRPIVMAPNKPSYLRDDFVAQLSGLVNIESVVSGGGELKYITNENEIIVAQQISTALDRYLDLSKDKRDQIKLIITGQNAPFNSHEATTFRANNKAVVYAQDFLAAQKIITSSPSFIADGQRGILASSQGFDETRDRVVGWRKHPIARTLSMIPELFIKEAPLSLTRPIGLKDQSLLNLIDIIRNSDERASLEQTISELIYRVNNFVDKTLLSRLNDPALKYENIQLRTLKQQFNRQAANILAIATEDKLERLIGLNFFEAILMQHPHQEDVVATMSIMNNIKEHIDEGKLAEWLGLKTPVSPEAGFAVQYAKLKKYALNENVEQAWQAYLSDYKRIDPAINQKFARLIRDLVELDAIPLWLNLSFWQAWLKNPNTVEVTASLVDEHERIKPYLEEIFSWHNRLRAFAFGDISKPDRFEMAFAKLTTSITEPLVDLVADKYHQLSLFERTVSLSLLSHLVNNMDVALKDLSRSNEYDSYQKKARNFRDLLIYGNDLSETLAQRLFSPEERKDLHYFFKRHGESGPKSYFGRIKEFLNQASLELEKSEDKAMQLFNLSYGFNVSGARLTSSADFDRSTGVQPSLEAIFTLIHQNLLTLIGKKLSTEIESNLPLPVLVASLVKQLRAIKLEGVDSRTEMTEIVLDNERLRLTLNQSLKHHSATYIIDYRFSDRKVTLSIKFIGDARDRWALFGSLARWLLPKDLSLTNVEGPFVDGSKGEVEIIWMIDSLAQVTNAVSTTRKLADNSFGENFERIATELINDYSQKFTSQELIDICHSEILFNLENAITSKLFADELCFQAYKNEKEAKKNVLQLLRENIAKLAKAKKFSKALQYLMLAHSVVPQVEQKHEIQLLTTFIDNSDLSGVNMAEISFGKNNFFEYIFPLKLTEDLWQKIRNKISNESFLTQNQRGDTSLHLAVSLSYRAERLMFVKSLVEDFPQLKEVKNNEGKRPIDTPRLSSEIKALLE